MREPGPKATSRRPLAAGSALGIAALCATAAVAPFTASGPNAARPAHGLTRPDVRREYGAPVAVGNGHARVYVVVDRQAGGRPLEVGIALDEAAMDGLPAPASKPAASGADVHEYLLPLPAENPTPYRLVELDWNPGGHEPPGVYDVPHFDFHFYTIPLARRNAIDTAAVGPERFAGMSAHLPPAVDRTPHYVALAAPSAPPAAVPRMGVHWADVRSPELQRMLGTPAEYRPFTTTFLHGSWDGHVIFDEPMVTRAFMLGRKGAATAAQRDSVIPLPAAPRARPAGYYPAAYRVRYDPGAREYQVALTHLARRG